MHVLLWPGMQSSLFDPRVYHQGIPALVEEMLCALGNRGLWVWGWVSVVTEHRPQSVADAARHGTPRAPAISTAPLPSRASLLLE